MLGQLQKHQAMLGRERQRGNGGGGGGRFIVLNQPSGAIIVRPYEVLESVL